MDDIGTKAGIRGPSVYKHYASKQQVLYEIMSGTMKALILNQSEAIASTADTVEQLRRAAESHARYHMRNRFEAFVGNREIYHLELENRVNILDQRRTYELALRGVIEAGVAEGRFSAPLPRLASYAILDMGIGISAWYRPDGHYSENQIAYEYGGYALKLVGVH